MIALLKKLFQRGQAADLVTNEAIDIIRRYQRLSQEHRREMMAGFEHAKARQEFENGPMQTWTVQQKALVAKQTLQMAKDAYEFAPHGSCGVALVGLYLEAQALPGPKALRLVALIDEWHRRQAQL
jgi:hypothetical protein